jgi:2-oxoglutarate ferredoxin oxidoreductase subunit gamma
MDSKETHIIIAGFGGQGVVLTGNVIARAAVIEGKNITGMISYGAEMRGGTANSTVIISEEEIASPFVLTPDVAIIMNQPSLDKFEPSLKTGGTVIVNTSMLMHSVGRKDLEVTSIDATNIARQLGNIRVANIVALGAFIKTTKLLKVESVNKALKDLFSTKKAELVDINLKAFAMGLES